jgi:hypothetical protein
MRYGQWLPIEAQSGDLFAVPVDGGVGLDCAVSSSRPHGAAARVIHFVVSSSAVVVGLLW